MFWQPGKCKRIIHTVLVPTKKLHHAGRKVGSAVGDLLKTAACCVFGLPENLNFTQMRVISFRTVTALWGLWRSEAVHADETTQGKGPKTMWGSRKRTCRLRFSSDVGLFMEAAHLLPLSLLLPPSLSYIQTMMSVLWRESTPTETIRSALPLQGHILLT